MKAHIRQSDGVPQGLYAHCRAVSDLAADSLATLGLRATGALAGILHDMGKATQGFQEYLEESFLHPERRGKAEPHAPIGAIYAYESWFSGTTAEKLTAQIVSMAVYGHHAGLPDCLDNKGKSPYLFYFSLEEKNKLCYDEAVGNYLREVAPPEEMDALYARAKDEIVAVAARLEPGQQAHALGMIARSVLSAVVDADRWDSVCFEHGVDLFASTEKVTDWKALSSRLEAYMADEFTPQSDTTPRPNINNVRARISRECLDCAPLEPGIFALTVPTGGGKTYATLRYALAHAALKDMRRVFYIIPFNTILDQNAADIRRALGSYEGILEHHSGIVYCDEGESAEAEYKRLTERWDSPIILTSMVHFLNTLYRKENTDARRMRALAHSVLIFDEVQALPKKCTCLFESAIRFLVRFYGCTVVLCTATQPQLELPARSMIGDVRSLFFEMRRVRYVDETRCERKNAEAAKALAALMDRHGSVLAVVNTKPVAQEVYQLIKKELGERAACFHLSTYMCPAHRIEILDEVKARTGGKVRMPTFLVSTALIEAGINVSFPAVVRSLTGLASVIQAAGRCNRNDEDDMGTVYLWRFTEEKLDGLEDIRRGQELCDIFLQHYKDDANHIGDPDVIAQYFADERGEFEEELPYPHSCWKTNLCDMLSKNEKCCNTAKKAGTGTIARLAMPQSFREAGEAFRVIDENTRTFLVPYGEGKEIIAALLGRHDMREEIRLIRRAQRFSVNVYEGDYHALQKMKALYPVGDTGILALADGFYSKEAGLRFKPEEMDLLNFD